MVLDTQEQSEIKIKEITLPEQRSKLNPYFDVKRDVPSQYWDTYIRSMRQVDFIPYGTNISTHLGIEDIKILDEERYKEIVENSDVKNAVSFRINEELLYITKELGEAEGPNYSVVFAKLMNFWASAKNVDAGIINSPSFGRSQLAMHRMHVASSSENYPIYQRAEDVVGLWRGYNGTYSSSVFTKDVFYKDLLSEFKTAQDSFALLMDDKSIVDDAKFGIVKNFTEGAASVKIISEKFGSNRRS